MYLNMLILIKRKEINYNAAVLFAEHIFSFSFKNLEVNCCSYVYPTFLNLASNKYCLSTHTYIRICLLIQMKTKTSKVQFKTFNKNFSLIFMFLINMAILSCNVCSSKTGS